MDGIEPAGHAILGSFAPDRNAQMEDLTRSDLSGRLNDVMRLDVVQRSDLIIGTPAVPIRQIRSELFKC